MLSTNLINIQTFCIPKCSLSNGMTRIKSHMLLFFLVLFIICMSSLLFSKHSFYVKWSTIDNNILNSSNFTINTTNNSKDDSIKSDVLLIYVYVDNHPFASGNLRYFIETVVREGDGADYVFILQQIHGKEINEKEMPLLPKTNAWYIQHENQCFDYGTIGWFFAKYTIGNPWRDENSLTNSSGLIQHPQKFDLTQYKYFIFMNSSVRGPFFPPYFLKFLSDYQKEFYKSFYWYYIFTKRINDRIKLAGPTVSCTPPLHVQSYLLTTDYTGLALLLQTSGKDGSERPGVFGCYPSLQETIWFSELAISARLLDAGYALDCPLTIYQGVAFSKKSDYKCPVQGTPYLDRNLDGTTLEPYEVLFIKYNGKARISEAQGRAELYQRWIKEAKMSNTTA